MFERVLKFWQASTLTCIGAVNPTNLVIDADIKYLKVSKSVLLNQKEKHYKAQFLNFVLAKWGKKLDIKKF